MIILILDDDPEERFAFSKLLKELYPHSKADYTDNLLDFHECLFEKGNKIAQYDKIIIDAQIDIPNDLDEEEYIDFLKEININDNDIKNNNLMGWKYCDQVIRKKMPNQLCKVLIKTGFANSIQNSSTPEQLEGIIILNKNDMDYQKKLKEFLNKS